MYSLGGALGATLFRLASCSSTSSSAGGGGSHSSSNGDAELLHGRGLCGGGTGGNDGSGGIFNEKACF
jgi:hypothetical protein